MLTPELKDKVLCQLTMFSDYRCKSSDIRVDGLTHPQIIAILRQMAHEGLVVIVEDYSFVLNLAITARVDEFWRMGGYSVRELLFKTNLEKLSKELDSLSDQLRPSVLDSLNEISSLASAVVGALQLFR